jgi:uncharacterized protein YyaL (SSP411 family)
MQLLSVFKPQSLRTFLGAFFLLILAGCGPAPKTEFTDATVQENEKIWAHTNALIHEQSPYLLQHAHNPVNWYPWGEAAFEKARVENKPIFLSVGYSTCYWCHVMEKESFEDETVAAVLNEHFIAIKVDREERPDIDGQYMLATQLGTGQGGWPNSVWLTPEGKPWMAGTYFSKAKFINLLEQLALIWKTRQAEMEAEADRLSAAMVKAASAPSGTEGKLNAGLIQAGLASLLEDYDAQLGGFGDAPKFPPHDTLALIAQEYREHKNPELLMILQKTLDAMWLGGIHDHIGGGFHRYSTDAKWLLPHFEKMLYDNAQLMRAYTEGFSLTGEPRYHEAVEEIYTWLVREMTAPGGAFYSAIDAGEVGAEGETQVWHRAAIDSALGATTGAEFAKYYNIKPNGNFIEQRTQQRTGENIPHLLQPIEALALEDLIDPIELAKRLKTQREKLLVARLKRPQAHTDDKILTSWNGLMIGALAHAGKTFNDARYTEAAARAANFILEKMTNETGGLLRTYRDGIAKLPGYLDDYAYFTQGVLELYHSTQSQQWLETANRLAEQIISSFEDSAKGGFYYTSTTHEDLILRSKNIGGGGNLPDANGVSVLTLLDLAQLKQAPHFARAAERALQSLSGLMQRSPAAAQQLLLATRQYLNAPQLVLDSANTDHNNAKIDDGHLARATANALKIEASVSPLPLKAGSKAQITVTLTVQEGWYLYGKNPAVDFLIPTEVIAKASSGLIVRSVESPTPEEKMDPLLGQKLRTYSGKIDFLVSIEVSENCNPGDQSIELIIVSQACGNGTCLAPQTTHLPIQLKIIADA